MYLLVQDKYLLDDSCALVLYGRIVEIRRGAFVTGVMGHFWTNNYHG